MSYSSRKGPQSAVKTFSGINQSRNSHNSKQTGTRDHTSSQHARRRRMVARMEIWSWFR